MSAHLIKRQDKYAVEINKRLGPLSSIYGIYIAHEKNSMKCLLSFGIRI